MNLLQRTGGKDESNVYDISYIKFNIKNRHFLQQCCSSSCMWGEIEVFVPSQESERYVNRW